MGSEDVNVDEECTRYAMYKLRQRAYKELLLHYIVPLVRAFISDDLSDTVRFTLVNELHSIASVMGRTLSAKFLLPVLLSAVHDRSWRVRFTMANNMSSITPLLMSSTTLHKRSDDNNNNTRNDSSNNKFNSAIGTTGSNSSNNSNSNKKD